MFTSKMSVGDRCRRLAWWPGSQLADLVALTLCRPGPAFWTNRDNQCIKIYKTRWVQLASCGPK